MIEHPNLYRTNPVHIFASAFAGMTRFRPLAGSGMPSALYRTGGFQNPDPFTALFTTPQTERRTQRTQWVTRVPVRAGMIPGWLVRELPTSGEVTRRDKSPGD
jgi:hypothetical protein